MYMNEREGTNQTYTTLHQEHRRTVVVSLDIRWLDLMPKYGFFCPGPSNMCKDHPPWKSLLLQVSQAERVYPSLKSSSDLSRTSDFLKEMAELSTAPRRLSLGMK
jgi:hypothetical protein